ncbi:NAD-dependent epimerase/dehydratase family protein [Sphingosinicella humi]|uniref:NAD-dependent epimerase/dehydratase family protein n=1 Tax=Allosphingosinicella humi TaxID=2068657 RepID=UPI001FB1A205|nr:NAD-dependent epimerase/dehydratase family protein [Sphingosinicella humi]
MRELWGSPSEGKHVGKRILMAGGAGFLGSHLVDRLLRRNELELLVVVDDFWTGTRENLKHIDDRRMHVVDCSVQEFATHETFDEIIHFASPASPPWYMSDPARTIKANVGGALNLINLIRKGGRISFASTSEVYGDPMITPQPESYRGVVDCTGPRSSYDESKRCTESLLFEMRRTRDLDVRIVRLFNVYGPRTRIDDGRAVSNFIGQALSDGILTVYGDGRQTRSWGYVDDIIDALERYFWLDETSYCGPLNIGNDREIAVIDVAHFIASLVPGSQIKFLPPVPQDPTNRRPDLTLARQVLPGWAAKVEYEEGVRRTFDWFKSKMTLMERIPEPPPPLLLQE